MAKRLVLVLMGLLLVTFTQTFFPRTADAHPEIGGAPQLERGSRVVIRGEDTHVPLYAAPGALAVQNHIRSGAVVVIEDIAAEQGALFYLVFGVANRRLRGWVSEKQLTPVEQVGHHIGALQLCVRSKQVPQHCGMRVTLGEGDALYAFFEYAGARPGEHLQWQLLVDGEQYTGAPILLERAHGAMDVNLLKVRTLPRRFAGNWTIRFMFEGGHTQDVTIWVAAPAPPNPPQPRSLELQTVFSVY